MQTTGGDSTTPTPTPTPTPTDSRTQSSAALTELSLEETATLPGVSGDTASYEGDFFVNDARGDISRVSPSGETIWNQQYSHPHHTLPLTTVTAFTPDAVYWGYEAKDDTNTTPSGKVVRRDLETGEKHWEFEAPHTTTPHSIVQVSPEVLAVALNHTDDSKATPAAIGVDVETGEERWRTPNSDGRLRDLVVHDGTLYGLRDGDVYRIQPGENPTRVLQNIGVTASVSADSSGVYLGHLAINAVDLDTMEQRWTRSPASQVRVTGLADGGLFIGTDTGFVYRLDTDSGETVWKARVRSAVDVLEFTANAVWVPDGRSLHAFALADGKQVHESEFFAEDTFHQHFETTPNTLCHPSGGVGIVLHSVSSTWNST